MAVTVHCTWWLVWSPWIGSIPFLAAASFRVVSFRLGHRKRKRDARLFVCFSHLMRPCNCLAIVVLAVVIASVVVAAAPFELTALSQKLKKKKKKKRVPHRAHSFFPSL
jgi:hypothetical protein